MLAAASGDAATPAVQVAAQEVQHEAQQAGGLVQPQQLAAMCAEVAAMREVEDDLQQASAASLGETDDGGAELDTDGGLGGDDAAVGSEDFPVRAPPRRATRFGGGRHVRTKGFYK